MVNKCFSNKGLRWLVVVCIAMLCPSLASAVSLDVAALSSSSTRQIMATGHHIQKYAESEIEISGQYIKSQDRPDAWDFGVENVYYFPYRIRSESDYRYFHDRSTFAGALGIGRDWLALSAGFRTEYPNNAPKDTYAKATATMRIKKFPYALTGKVEALRADANNKRVDYRVEGRYQVGFFYLGVKVEEMKHIKLQALSLGVSF